MYFSLCSKPAYQFFYSFRKPSSPLSALVFHSVCRTIRYDENKIGQRNLVAMVALTVNKLSMKPSPKCFARAMLLMLLLNTTAVVAFGTNHCHRYPSSRIQRQIIASPSLCSDRSSSRIFHPIRLHLSSAEIEEVEAALSAPTNPTYVLGVDAHSGLSDEEFSMLVATVEDAYAETVGLAGVSCETKILTSSGADDDSSNNGVLVGALRRVLSLRTNLAEESAECLRALIAERMDHLIYGSGELQQPVLVSVRPPEEHKDENSMEDRVGAILQTEIEQYGLRTPIHSNKDEKDDDSRGDETTMYTPAFRIEIDGAETHIDDSGETFWDTSSVVVFDKLVNDDLRKRLLEVVNGKSLDDNNWNDVENGPDPNRWIRGGLQDIPDSDEDQGENNEGQALSCWGLPVEAIEEICLEQHDAIEEFESILINLFPQFVVSRLPEAVYGECVSPLTANAPVAGEEGIYDYHIDGDPLQTPPSPWTDIYGRYPNRSPGKPRFVSCILYLNDEWDESEWGASTKFYDPPTNDSYEVNARPGRCVFLDQDLGHTVTPPKSAAGKRPRYSLVWKLVLHPKTENQDMTDLSASSSSRSPWPEPVLFGSAAIPS